MARARRTCVEKVWDSSGVASPCPTLAAVDGNRCAPHQRDYEERRGSRQQRGYDARHERIRRRLLPKAIGTLCPLCGEVMDDEQAADGGLHLDHSIPLWVNRQSIPDRIVHARCNLKRPRHPTRSA